MLREINYLKDNAKTVAKNEVPTNIPMYFFISDEQEAVASGWNEALTGYLSKPRCLPAVSKIARINSSNFLN